MALAPPTTADLAKFTGRPEDSFTAFVDEALQQATDLFQLATSLTELPADTGESAHLSRLARNGVMAMADAIYLSQPFAAAKASPFQSETIGAYSYSKVSSSIVNGLPTGVGWFDLAVQQLTSDDVSGAFDSTDVSVFENEGVWVTSEGQRFVPGPQDAAYGAYGVRTDPD